MRKIILFLLPFLLLIFSTISVYAHSGCCSWHGGVCGGSCCDGTPLSAICAPYYQSSTQNDSQSWLWFLLPAGIWFLWISFAWIHSWSKEEWSKVVEIIRFIIYWLLFLFVIAVGIYILFIIASVVLRN